MFVLMKNGKSGQNKTTRAFSGALALLVCCVLGLSACSTHSPLIIKDSGPREPVDVSHVPDAVPRYEPRTIAGNRTPYEVLGKTYHVLPESQGYIEDGIASWYGNKFHGRNTSNGEVYSMYGMTAAHKSLPIPSYVRVTNLRNGKQVVVRVNDRGPFHEGRIIDLSYAGASKLGFLKQGTAPVRVEALEPEEGGPAVAYRAVNPADLQTLAPTSTELYRLPEQTFLQAGAFSQAFAAEKVRAQLAQLTSLPVSVVVPTSDHLYRVRVGPIKDTLMLLDVRQLLEKHKYPSPHVVYE